MFNSLYLIKRDESMVHQLLASFRCVCASPCPQHGCCLLLLLRHRPVPGGEGGRGIAREREGEKQIITCHVTVVTRLKKSRVKSSARETHLRHTCIQRSWLLSAQTTALSRALATTPLARALAGGLLLPAANLPFDRSRIGVSFLERGSAPMVSPSPTSSKSSNALAGVCLREHHLTVSPRQSPAAEAHRGTVSPW